MHGNLQLASTFSETELRSQLRFPMMLVLRTDYYINVAGAALSAIGSGEFFEVVGHSTDGDRGVGVVPL